MTNLELRSIIADLAVRQAETDRQLKETDRQLKKYIQELGKQIGGLGEKFGGFTEGMAFPSMKKILQERFGMNVVSPNVSVRKNGRSMELDVLALSNADINEIYVVEVKSHLKEDGLEQMLTILRDFRYFFPDHDDKKVYGILAAVHIPQAIRERVLRAGIYLACIHDDNFQLAVPEGFQPRAF